MHHDAAENVNYGYDLHLVRLCPLQYGLPIKILLTLRHGRATLLFNKNFKAVEIPHQYDHIETVNQPKRQSRSR
jgi:hypothetical protein